MLAFASKVNGRSHKELNQVLTSAVPCGLTGEYEDSARPLPVCVTRRRWTSSRAAREPPSSAHQSVSSLPTVSPAGLGPGKPLFFGLEITLFLDCSWIIGNNGGFSHTQKSPYQACNGVILFCRLCLCV